MQKTAGTRFSRCKIDCETDVEWPWSVFPATLWAVPQLPVAESAAEGLCVPQRRTGSFAKAQQRLRTDTFRVQKISGARSVERTCRDVDVLSEADEGQ